VIKVLIYNRAHAVYAIRYISPFTNTIILLMVIMMMMMRRRRRRGRRIREFI